MVDAFVVVVLEKGACEVELVEAEEVRTAAVPDEVVTEAEEDLVAEADEVATEEEEEADADADADDD